MISRGKGYGSQYGILSIYLPTDNKPPKVFRILRYCVLVSRVIQPLWISRRYRLCQHSEETNIKFQGSTLRQKNRKQVADSAYHSRREDYHSSSLFCGGVPCESSLFSGWLPYVLGRERSADANTEAIHLPEWKQSWYCLQKTTRSFSAGKFDFR